MSVVVRDAARVGGESVVRDAANKVLKTWDNTRSMTTNVTSTSKSSSSELVVFQKKKIPINLKVVDSLLTPIPSSSIRLRVEHNTICMRSKRARRDGGKEGTLLGGGL